MVVAVAVVAAAAVERLVPPLGMVGMVVMVALAAVAVLAVVAEIMGGLIPEAMVVTAGMVVLAVEVAAVELVELVDMEFLAWAAWAVLAAEMGQVVILELLPVGVAPVWAALSLTTPGRYYWLTAPCQPTEPWVVLPASKQATASAAVSLT
jgi:hypothetical protein